MLIREDGQSPPGHPSSLGHSSPVRCGVRLELGLGVGLVGLVLGLVLQLGLRLGLGLGGMSGKGTVQGGNCPRLAHSHSYGA